jgi:hypothetical protein
MDGALVVVAAAFMAFIINDHNGLKKRIIAIVSRLQINRT